MAKENDIINKIQKLMRLAESTTYISEAESALLQAQRLSVQFVPVVSNAETLEREEDYDDCACIST